jgi:hypothetical protein
MFAALASCVFLWGLQYKLSLYDPPQAASHQVPMAKLLSRDEQSSTPEESAYIQTQPTIKVLSGAFSAALFSLLLVSIFSLPASSRRRRTEYPSPQWQQILLETHYVRPPPALHQS